jgi:hypothetical protein
MVLGVSRSRIRSDAAGLFTVKPSPVKFSVAADWMNERGTVRFESSADLVGGFPGYAERGCQLESARLTITNSYLLVDEGQPAGFGLPLRWIEGTTIIQRSGRHDNALRIFYRERGLPRSFTMRFGSNRLSSRGANRSARAQHELHSAGLEDRFANEPPIEPNFKLPWEESGGCETEHAIWTGKAMAPLQVGAETTPSEVWLTTKSLIWGGGAGDGLNRIPLTLLMDVTTERLRDRAGTPAVYVSIGDGRTGRFEIPFVFNLHEVPDRNFRERGAFQVGLSSRGLPEGRVAATWQPWRVDPGQQVRAGDEAPIDSFDLLGVEISPHVLAGEAHEEAARTFTPFIVLTEADSPIETESDTPIELAGAAGLSMETPIEETVSDSQSIDGQLEAIDRPVAVIQEMSPETTIMVEATDVVVAAVAFEPPTSEDKEPVGSTSTSAALVVDLGEQIVPLEIEAVLDIASDEELDAPSSIDEQHSLAAKIVAALSEVELEKDPTERFIPRAIDSSTEAPASDDVVLAEWSAGTPVHDQVPVDLQLTESWAEPRDVAANVAPERESDEVVSVSSVRVADERIADQERPADAGANNLWVDVRSYEACAIGALAEALRAIDNRIEGDAALMLSEHVPGSWEQSRAEVEIRELAARGAVSTAEAKARRERVLVLGDVSVRLRTLVELFDGGYLSAEELEAKRSQLVKRLSLALIP